MGDREPRINRAGYLYPDYEYVSSRAVLSVFPSTTVLSCQGKRSYFKSAQLPGFSYPTNIINDIVIFQEIYVITKYRKTVGIQVRSINMTIVLA